jgi:hypothetical protein
VTEYGIVIERCVYDQDDGVGIVLSFDLVDSRAEVPPTLSIDLWSTLHICCSKGRKGGGGGHFHSLVIPCQKSGATTSVFTVNLQNNEENQPTLLIVNRF